MVLVGEKYALTDTLFKQSTPKLADCTVNANVWDVADNTEIHIQRQGSKTASNKLKLKLKAVGSPTTSVVVEVRKGIQVDVSSSEAYWYWDSENIIATGTLPSSSFSNDYAEIEFTLDNNFGGKEWELLDIVVYQSTGGEVIVNASNYYVLACDKTQWSEAFSYVKVNGTTRSRQKLMPYCVSDWFVQTMLAKVDVWLYIYSWTLYVPSYAWYHQEPLNKQYTVSTNKPSGVLSNWYKIIADFKYTAMTFTSWATWINQMYTKNGSTSVNDSLDWSNLYSPSDLPLSKHFEFISNIPSIWLRTATNGSVSDSWSWTMEVRITADDGTKSGTILRPNAVKGIWENVACILFDEKTINEIYDMLNDRFALSWSTAYAQATTSQSINGTVNMAINGTTYVIPYVSIK